MFFHGKQLHSITIHTVVGLSLVAATVREGIHGRKAREEENTFIFTPSSAMGK